MKKQIPDYIPKHDAKILAKMRVRSYRLDMSLFTIFGVRFGWSSVIGLIPAFGDIADSLLALALVWRCTKIECGLGPAILMQMLFNVLIDFVIGLIPILGDLVDAGFKCNTRNVLLLAQRLDEAYKPNDVKHADAERQKIVKQQRMSMGVPYNAELEAPAASVIQEVDYEPEDHEYGITGTTGTQPVIESLPAQSRNSWWKYGRGDSGKAPLPDVERRMNAANQPVNPPTSATPNKPASTSKRQAPVVNSQPQTTV